MLAALKVGQEIEYQHLNRGRWMKYKGRVVQVTDRHIAIQTPKYPDSIPICDLVSGQARITSPAMDWSAVRLENRQIPVLVGKAEPLQMWKERKEREGMANAKYDWETYGPKAVNMLMNGLTIPDIARELDYPYHAVRDYLKRHAPEKAPADLLPTPMSAPTESPHPASVPEPAVIAHDGFLVETGLLTAVDGEYQRRIFERFHQQRQKGIDKYGQPLEDNPASMGERLEHLAQELTDGLMYVEWIKALPGEYGFREYAIAALRTAQQDESDQDLMINGVFGLMGEAGEVVDHLKKHLFQGHELNPAKVAEELGDVLWYVNLIAAACGCELDAIARGNIAKLQARYPGAGFDAERSINRVEVTE